MSEFMWPPKNININVIDISEELISLKDFIKKSDLPDASVPAIGLLLYEDLKLPFNEWKDLIQCLKSLTKTELLTMESDYYEKNAPISIGSFNQYKVLPRGFASLYSNKHLILSEWYALLDAYMDSLIYDF